jgi:NTP pyrophosphatase (non-canonical NTP hydrolase)
MTGNRECALTRDDLLVLLIEECAEVIQATTKAQRFGFDHHQEGYGLNSDVLSHEVGDVIAVIEALRPFLSETHLECARSHKIARAERWKRLLTRKA